MRDFLPPDKGNYHLENTLQIWGVSARNTEHCPARFDTYVYGVALLFA